MALSAGSIALGHGSHASARNLAFRRDIFERIEGYGDMIKIISGDDTLLLHRIQRISKRSIVTEWDKSTHVYSNSPENFKSFFRQRIRHMSTGKYFDPMLIGIGFIVYFFHFLIFTLFILSLISTYAFILFIIAFLGKITVDCLVALRTKAIFGLEVQWKRFVINELFLTGYMAVMPILGLITPVKWK
ncbi:MAG TPA: hypothetical protein ENH82_07905 [bacterium]|nr:hypothetical protein [bacterium]